MAKRKYIITCPVCGKTLFKSQSETGCAIDVQCPKCGSCLNVKLSDYMLSVKETSFEYEARAK